MGTIKFIVLKKTHLDFLYGLMHGFLYTHMVVPVVASLWVFLSKSIAYVFGSVLGYLFSRSSSDKPFAESDSGACSDSNCDELKEKQSSDHVDQSNEEAESSSSFVASSSKYEFSYGNGFSGFIEEPKAKSYTVQEFYMGSYDQAGGDIGKFGVETEDVVNEEKTEDYGENFTGETEESVEEKTEELEKVLEKEPEESVLRFSFNWDFVKYIKREDVVEETAKVADVLEKPKIEEDDVFEVKTEESVENHVIGRTLEENASGTQGNGDHVEEKFDNFFEGPAIDMYIEKWNLEKEEPKKGVEMMFSQRNVVGVESITHEALSSRQTHTVTDGQNEENMEHEIHEPNSNISISDSEEEFIELVPMSEKLRVVGETKSGKDLSFEDDEGFDYEDTESMASSEEDEEDDDDDDELMEQLRMEMRMARTGGLPTILEESSESPKMVEQLGPLKIDDEKYEHKDHIAEIQKVYKGYSDKMKKLDILNSQTMHAISLLQLKDPVRVSSTSGKSSMPAIKSLLSWPFKQRTPEADPVMKLITDLHMDFETVYVGQVCLSWEILHWQYGKLKKLSECDSFGTRQYNQVAGEFQRFQVLVQRFLEDEPFQNVPRVENYTKNRCKVRRLLQVPVIKDDRSKYKLEDGLSNEMLTDIIEESMHVFWDFLRADKDDTNATSKAPQQAKVAPHDPIDLELLMDVRTDLLKKEKRFKEIQRSTNCILKKFQRQQQQQEQDVGNLLDEALFMAQVELKLVSRVLNMLKISTDQLIWCHEKLQRINFRSRKIEIEPSFTLFPC